MKGQWRHVGTVDYFSYPNAEFPVNIYPYTAYFIHCIMKTENFGFVIQHIILQPTHTTLFWIRILFDESLQTRFSFSDLESRMVSRHVYHFRIYFISHSIHSLLVSHFSAFGRIRKSYELIIVYSLHNDCTRFRFQLLNILEIAFGVVEVIITIIIHNWLSMRYEVWIPYIQLWYIRNPNPPLLFTISFLLGYEMANTKWCMYAYEYQISAKGCNIQ